MDADLTRGVAAIAIEADPLAAFPVRAGPPNLLDLCAEVEARDGDILAALVGAGAGGGSGATAPPEGLGIASLDRQGRLQCANALMLQCLPNPRSVPEVAAILRRLEGQARAIGIAPTADGAAACVLAVRGSQRTGWPILAPYFAWAGDHDRAAALILLAPSRSEPLFNRTAQALGLSRVETRLARALLDTDNLQEAAARIGVTRETAKAAIANANHKVRAASTADLLGLLVELSLAPLSRAPRDVEAVQRLLGLTQAEARVALALVNHGGLPQAARALGLSAQTVKTHKRSIFAKLGVQRERMFRRLMSEALALDVMASMSEVRPEAAAAPPGLTLLTRPDGRRVACVDYGPTRGAAIFVGHGDSTGRLLAPPLVGALQAAGFRPVVVQRPGFGLTSGAPEDFLGTAASDMAFVLEALRAERCSLLMRDGGVAAGLEFARRHPKRLDRALLQNPRQPNGVRLGGPSPFAPVRRLMRAQPALIERLGDIMRLQSRSDLLKAALRRIAAAAPSDAALLTDEGVLEALVDDIHGLVTFSATGFVDEHALFAQGWRPPVDVAAGAWTVFGSGRLFFDADRSPWQGLPGVRFALIEDAGFFVQHTHPQRIVSLLEAR